MLSAGLGELPTLLQVTWRACPAGPPMRLLLDREVPYKPGVCAMVSQDRSLGSRRCQAITRHSNMISSGSDISEEVKRRCPA
jgi:hypothetical protein